MAHAWLSLISPACTDRFFDDVPNNASPFSVGDSLVDQVEDVHRQACAEWQGDLAARPPTGHGRWS